MAWEYKQVDGSRRITPEYLSELGSLHWELVSVVQTGDGSWWFYYFKRPKL